MIDQILNSYGQVLYLLYTMKKPMYSKEIAESLGTLSQMTVGEKLREMEEEKLVDREEIGNIILYKLNGSGVRYAKTMQSQFHKMVNLEKIADDMGKRVIRKRKDYPTKVIKRISSSYQR